MAQVAQLHQLALDDQLARNIEQAVTMAMQNTFGAKVEPGNY